MACHVHREAYEKTVSPLLLGKAVDMASHVPTKGFSDCFLAKESQRAGSTIANAARFSSRYFRAAPRTC